MKGSKGKYNILIFSVAFLVLTSLSCFDKDRNNPNDPDSKNYNTPPNTPSNVAATRGEEEIIISWDASDGADSYNLYWSNSTGVTSANGTKIESAVSPYEHTDLIPGNIYYYVVTAVNTNGESDDSEEVSEIPDLSAPLNVTATAGQEKITISWDASDGADSYDLYWSNSTGVTSANGTKIESAVSPYEHTDLIPGNIYYYVVTAVNTNGESDDSEEVSEIPDLSAPLNVTATAGQEKITISWDASDGADSYNLYWSNSTDVTSANGTMIESAVSPYEHIGLLPDKTYYYVVIAVNTHGESDDSEECFETPSVWPLPTIPTFSNSGVYGGYGKALAVGELLYAGSEIKAMKKGKAVKNIHYVNDIIWNIEL